MDERDDDAAFADSGCDPLDRIGADVADGEDARNVRLERLEGIISALAMYVTLLILGTRQRDDVVASQREQLTLELAILSEQKSAKIIQLLEDLRRDHPDIVNRIDAEALTISFPTDPQEVLDAIKESRADPA